MSRIFTFILLACISFVHVLDVSGQNSSHLKASLLDTFRIGPTSHFPLFGGVSTMEWMPENRFFPASKSSPALLLFTDHSPGRATNGSFQRSLVFAFDYKTKKLKKNFRPLDSNGNAVVNSVEAVRYSAALKTLFYSYESDGSTGIVGLNKKQKPDTILISDVPPAFDNRGIEAMCIGPDTSLWFCKESGSADDPVNVAFTRILYNKMTRRHDTNQKSIYRYPFDKCSFLTDSLCRLFGGNIGNGISEMLTVPEELGGGLLVLERCFDGRTCHVRLFHSRIIGPGMMSKDLLFDFNDANLKPDNMEGMSWGPSEHNKAVLYIISDDNYSAQQRTQLVRLTIVKK